MTLCDKRATAAVGNRALRAPFLAAAAVGPAVVALAVAAARHPTEAAVDWRVALQSHLNSIPITLNPITITLHARAPPARQ